MEAFIEPQLFLQARRTLQGPGSEEGRGHLSQCQVHLTRLDGKGQCVTIAGLANAGVGLQGCVLCNFRGGEAGHHSYFISSLFSGRGLGCYKHWLKLRNPFENLNREDSWSQPGLHRNECEGTSECQLKPAIGIAEFDGASMPYTETSLLWGYHPLQGPSQRPW